jgi:hypothetical protein
MHGRRHCFEAFRWESSFMLKWRPSYLISVSSSFPNDISASFRTNPDLMRLFGIDIDSCTRTKSLLFRFLIFGIRDCQFPLRDEMCSQPVMGVWRVVCISAVPSASQLRLKLDF